MCIIAAPGHQYRVTTEHRTYDPAPYDPKKMTQIIVNAARKTARYKAATAP